MIAIEEKHLAIVKNILSHYPYAFYVFGSRALGKAREFSDLDLCFTENIPAHVRLKLEEAFEESDLPYTVDLVDWQASDTDFQTIMSRDMVCIQPSSSLLKIEGNALGHFKYLPSLLGCAVQENEFITLIKCGFGSSMFNIAFGSFATSVHDISQVIQDTIQHFNGQPFAWWIPPSQRYNEFKECLLAAGFIIEAAEYAMFCELDRWHAVPAQNNNVQIKQVLNHDQLEDFIQLLDPIDATARRFYEKLQTQMLQEQERLFVGYKQNVPVVIGILFQQGDSAGIFSLLTDEHYQKQGLGTTMLHYLLHTAQTNGAHYATLSASSDTGFRIYQRLGFKTLGQFECFEWKGRSLDK